MSKLLWFFQLPGRIEAGPVFGHIYDGVMFVYAYGVDDSAQPQMLGYFPWVFGEEAAKRWLKQFVQNSLAADIYKPRRILRPGDQGPDFTLLGGV